MLATRSVSLALLFTTFACAGEQHDSKRTHTTEAPEAVTLEGEPETLGLTQSECNVAANINRVTASPRAQLFINAPAVLNDARAKVTGGVPGKWSFAYAMREILELPAPGTDPVKLAAEQAKVDEFLGRFTQTTAVNGFVPENRADTKAQILSRWGTTKGSDAKNYRTFDKAPFKLVSIVNRLDIVKKGKTAVTAGEGRFIYGFTGGPMTVILEYDLPIGAASNQNMASATAWATKWQGLKAFLADTNTGVAGVQPNQDVNTQPTFKDTASYLAALEKITELWANRNAQKRTGGTEASIAQIRTNEILTGPWQLREIVRTRTAAGAPVLSLTTVKNNPAKSLNNNAVLRDWLAGATSNNVTCKVATDKRTCSYNTANGQIPATIPNGSSTLKVLGAEANEDFTWFSGNTNTKLRFFAVQTCNGCHTTETGTGFTHVSETNGAPSAFLKTDLAARLANFKNLVCLAATKATVLNLTDAEVPSEDALNELRVEISPWTH